MENKNSEKIKKLDEPHTVAYIKNLKSKNKDIKVITKSGKEY